MNGSIIHKRGDTFAWGGVALLPSGPTWGVRCHVRSEPSIDAALPTSQDISASLRELTTQEIQTAQVTVPAGSTAYAVTLFQSALETQAWPIGMLLCDIEFRDLDDPAIVVSSPTFGVRVDKDPTHL